MAKSSRTLTRTLQAGDLCLYRLSNDGPVDDDRTVYAWRVMYVTVVSIGEKRASVRPYTRYDEPLARARTVGLDRLVW